MQLLVRHLDAERFEAAVHSPEDGPRAALVRQGGAATYVGLGLDRALNAFRPQVVHVHRAGWAEPEFLRPVRDYLAARPATVVVETNVFGRHDPSASGRCIDCHLFVSRFCSERFTRLTGIPADWPGHGVLYNPVDTDFFAAALPDGPAFARPVLGRISRPDPGKWSALALDMLPLLARCAPDFRCRVIGGIPEAEDYVRRHGLEAQVEFLPPVSTDAELAAFYGGLSLLAHANDTGESFGLVIAEAMACGLPVVTHPAVGDRDNAQLELVEHGVTGLVAQTAEQYAQAVAWLFAHPAEARAMGQAGRDKARRLFRAQDIAARLGRMYLDLLWRKAGGAA
ncbi:MAG: glycosyltransferase family 4 protein [Proteobacteria bacterium]|nr:glycosyltransferase family 4 protein [Pseudomonadota bacterium]MBU1595694.1 glycosyltransferase family 4 protein [Pseudomonadota bacterium]